MIYFVSSTCQISWKCLSFSGGVSENCSSAASSPCWAEKNMEPGEGNDIELPASNTAHVYKYFFTEIMRLEKRLKA